MFVYWSSTTPLVSFAATLRAGEFAFVYCSALLLDFMQRTSCQRARDKYTAIASSAACDLKLPGTFLWFPANQRLCVYSPSLVYSDCCVISTSYKGLSYILRHRSSRLHNTCQSGSSTFSIITHTPTNGAALHPCSPLPAETWGQGGLENKRWVETRQESSRHAHGATPTRLSPPPLALRFVGLHMCLLGFRLCRLVVFPMAS